MCGRLSVGKGFGERVHLVVGAAMCPAFNAAVVAAGHNAFRGPDP
jgi:hypothetical protein